MVTIQDIREAVERIKPIAHRTPVLTSRSFDAEAGVKAHFKCENFQKGGAFKIRGAANFIFSIPKEDLPRGVVGFSSGNHAQAVAIAAGAMGTKATLVMPLDASKAKLEATRGYGAEIVRFDRFQEDRQAIGRKISTETGATLVPPYDHPRIIAGQGTVALELVEEVRDLDAIVVPMGGGGLISGCATAAKALNPSIRVFGVEPEDGNDWFLSLAAGERIEIPPPKTVADGLRSMQPGEITFPIVQKLVDKVVLVSDLEIIATVRFLLTRMKILVEPSGAASAAAVMFRKLPAGLGKVGIVVSGGNVDFDQLASF